MGKLSLVIIMGIKYKGILGLYLLILITDFAEETHFSKI